MYPHQNGYQQGFSRGANLSGPPPAKKPKGNPIITYYPPPPGYKGPAQPHPEPPYQSHGWAQPGYQNYQSYPQQTYAAPQPYQHPQWSGHQQQPYPQNGFPPGQGHYPPTPGYSATPYGWQPPAHIPPTGPPPHWQPPSTAPARNEWLNNSAPISHVKTAASELMDGNGEVMPPPQSSTGGADDANEEYDGEYYFARHPEEVDPNFSLGWLHWSPPLPTKFPLPATFDEAELEAEAPRKPRAHDEQSISEYFTKERVDENLLSVRQTAAWVDVKGDLIYRALPAFSANVISKPELIGRYRNRPERARAETQLGNDTMELGSYGSSTHIKREESADEGDILSTLEEALNAGEVRTRGRREAVSSVHSRAASMSSTAGERITRPKPLAPIRDHAQEDILAALGVTGSPKMVYETPGPALAAAPPPSQRRNSGTAGTNRRGSPAGKYDATPRPKFNRSNGRKRSHGETEYGGIDGRHWWDDDRTPGPRSKHPRMDVPCDRR
ncbi:hypothetical protein B0A55_03250 [Friedmanniomyces simplex]|uniref:Uncharacterized protein n=1 Tax=Friedmanniomyces simplex TaxID=329884 RepID=A0A4U0XKD9_9PEZI|nr:hypothetical protein B0A55_04567 [Friedmanniomyces simplex]TKA76139.1 hypothetical protein B0A55_03250 [Friedmanniomyces simplex]